MGDWCGSRAFHSRELLGTRYVVSRSTSSREPCRTIGGRPCDQLMANGNQSGHRENEKALLIAKRQFVFTP